MDRLVKISLKPSRIARYLHVVVLLLAIIALWLCGLNPWAKQLLATAMLCMGAWQYRQLQQPVVSALGLEQDQWWVLIRHQRTLVELVDEQVVLPWLVVLNFRVKKAGEKGSARKHVLVLWPDTAQADDLRRLRVHLRNG